MVGDEISVAGVLEELAGGVNGGVIEGAFAGAGRPSSGSEVAWASRLAGPRVWWGSLEDRLEDCDAIL